MSDLRGTPYGRASDIQTPEGEAEEGRPVKPAEGLSTETQWCWHPLARTTNMEGKAEEAVTAVLFCLLNVSRLIKCVLSKYSKQSKQRPTSPAAPGSHERVSVNLPASHHCLFREKGEKGFECPSHEAQSTFQPQHQFSPFCR